MQRVTAEVLGVTRRSRLERAIDPRDPREVAELPIPAAHPYFGHVVLTVITGGTWLLVRRWWRRKPRKNRPWLVAGAMAYVLILLLAWLLL